MAEAVFSISADITPQLDERELQRQAQQLANQLNGILAKQVDKIGLKADSGSFRPFQKEIAKSAGLIEKLQDSLSAVPRTFGKIAQAGRGAFLKFTDAINVTRREFVGFGKGIRDTINDTKLFEGALDDVRAAGSSLSELPQRFEELAAQVRSGTSAIDQAAAGGDRFAQLFQPLQRQGEAARTEFVEINQSLDRLIQTVNKFAAATGKIDATTNDFDLLRDNINSLEKPFFRVQALLNKTGFDVGDFRKKIQATFAGAAGDPEKMVQALVTLRDEVQKTAGPLGLLRQVFGKVTAEERAAAKAIRLEFNASLIEAGQGDKVQGLQKIAAQFAILRDNVAKVVNFLAPVGRVFSNFATQAVGSLNSIGTSIASNLLGRLPQFRNEALSAEEAIGKFAFGASNLDIALSRMQASLNGAARTLGTFFGKNLTGPLKAGLNDLKTESARLGSEIVAGIGSGIRSGTSAITSAAVKLKDFVINGLKKAFGIASPAETTKPIGKGLIEGIVAGIKGAAGLVTKALSALTKGLTSLASQAIQFGKSVGTVAGVAIAGLGTKALLAGKEFNVLQQVINASLPVLVGSKQAAAGLLAEVNALNDSSPFARSAFLELTRVLAGFGVQAKKITPLIDAIQQTVAATGGSDQDLLELGQAFARIQSQGRLSLDVLQSFSSRGVDAVGILAKGFEKTQAEIREMISGGLIPAGKAIDVLTKGLKEKFDGATDAVAKNFPGALQRVEARLRDIGGTLLKAFITPTGGGALVTFLNNMADSLSHINKNLLPQIAPILQKVADALVIVSEKIESVVKSLSGEEFKGFVEGLKPLLPVLAALAGLIPAAFGFIPVIGPIIAGLGGPFTSLVAVLGVLAVQSESLRNTLSGLVTGLSGAFTFLKDNITGLVGAVGLGLAGVFGPLGASIAGLTTQLPLIGGAIEVVAAGFAGLTAPVAAVVALVAVAFSTLVLKSEDFRSSLVNLFKAIAPVAGLLKDVFAVAISIVQGVITALAPILVGIIDLFTNLFTALQPAIRGIRDFIKSVQESKAIPKFFEAIRGAVETAVTAINLLIKAYNKLPFSDIQEVKFSFKADLSEADLARDKFKDLAKVAEESNESIADSFKAASKEVETANAAASASIDAFTQGLQAVGQKIEPIFEAAKAVQSANDAIVAAQAKVRESTAALTQIESERARALEDVISPSNEVAVAERNLTRIRTGLKNIDKEIINIDKEKAKLLKERAALEGQEAADDRASLARAETRAQINLNQAIQAELDLLDELNPQKKSAIDLTGLTIDQLKTRLAASKLAVASNKGERKQTAQEIADAKTLANLDVEDAKAAAQDATNARTQFEVETKERIAEIDEQIISGEERKLELADDKADKLLTEIDALKDVNRLRAGETAQQVLILDFDQKIAGAKATIASDSQAIETAVKGAQLATADMQLKTATLRGDTVGIENAQRQIWNLKREGLGFDRATETALAGQLGTIQTLAQTIRDAKADVSAAIKEQQAAQTLIEFGKTLTNAEAIFGSLANGRFVPPSVLQNAKRPVEEGLRASLNGNVTNEDDENVALSPQFIDSLVSQVLKSPVSDIRQTLIELLKSNGLKLPGFATGYAPGDFIHQGMNDGMGMARMFEFGREAVLPLTRKFDMARVVNNPHVLPRILDALPRWSRPATAEADPMVDLASVVSSTRGSGGPANSDVYQKKSQREFAGTIGDAVKVAVKEAISESDGLGGHDIDVNIQPSSGNEVLIAREVERQLNRAMRKRFGKG